MTPLMNRLSQFCHLISIGLICFPGLTHWFTWSLAVVTAFTGLTEGKFIFE